MEPIINLVRRAMANCVPVKRITQSVLNPVRWCLDLECGHETWVTANRRPTRKTAKCERCILKARLTR